MTLLQNRLSLSSAIALQLSNFQQNKLSALQTVVLSSLEVCRFTKVFLFNKPV